MALAQTVVHLKMCVCVWSALPDGQGLVSMLRRRAGDSKVHVRKAAIQALHGMIKLQGQDSEHLNKQVTRASRVHRVRMWLTWIRW